jgi:DNA-binding FadR family transcriptional regulator
VSKTLALMPNDGPGRGRVVRPRVYEQIAQRLHDRIVQVQLRPGDRLPPEREMTERLGFRCAPRG